MRVKSRVSRPLLYEEVINELYRIIDQDQIRPGDKLPSERELTETLQISRNVLREAFHVLENRGIIISRQGSGRYLREVPDERGNWGNSGSLSRNLEMFSLLEAYEVRQVLEMKAVELAVRNADDADIEELENAYAQMKKNFSKSGTTIGEFDMHRLYGKKSGSQFMEQTLDIVLSAILDMMNNTFFDVLSSHDAEWELKSHREIIDAVESRDAELASKRMREHVQMTIDMLNSI